MTPRILFGDDHSEHADLAWMWLNTHTWPGWEVDVLTAQPLFPPVVGAPEGTEVWTPPNPRTAFDDAGLGTVRHLLAHQDPRLALTDPTDASLVVMGARGIGGVMGMLLGSTADYVAHHPPGPVVFIRDGERTRSVLLCVDGSEPSRRATAVLAGLPWISGLRVRVLAVPGEDTDAAAVAHEAAEVLEPAGAMVEVTSPVGSLDDAIERSEGDAELIAVGTRGVSGWRRLRSHSGAVALLRHTDRNVLIVPSEAAHD